MSSILLDREMSWKKTEIDLNVCWKVLVTLYVRSFGPVDEKEMSVSVDIYLKLVWVDRRLQGRHKNESLELLKYSLHPFMSKIAFPTKPLQEIFSL